MLTLLKGCCAGARTLSSCLCWAVGCCGSYKPDIMEFASWYLNLLDIRSCCQGNDGLKLRGTHSPHSECLDCRFYSLLNNTVLKLLQRYWYSNTLLLYTSIWWGAALFLFTFKCKSLHGLGTHCNKHITGWDLKGAFGNVCVCYVPISATISPPPTVPQSCESLSTLTSYFQGGCLGDCRKEEGKGKFHFTAKSSRFPSIIIIIKPGAIFWREAGSAHCQVCFGLFPPPHPTHTHYFSSKLIRTKAKVMHTSDHQPDLTLCKATNHK